MNLEKLVKFLKSERGTTAIEYALIALFVSVAVVGAVSALGIGLSNLFNQIAAAF